MNVVKIIRRYRVKGWDSEGDAEGPGEIVKGLSGEAVRIMKRPGQSKFISCVYRIRPFFRRRQHHRARLEETVR